MRRKKAVIYVYDREKVWSKSVAKDRPKYNIFTKLGSKKKFYSVGVDKKERVDEYIKNFVEKWKWNYIIYYEGKRLNK